MKKCACGKVTRTCWQFGHHQDSITLHSTVHKPFWLTDMSSSAQVVPATMADVDTVGVERKCEEYSKVYE